MADRHTILVRETILAVQREFPGWVLWEQQKVSVMVPTIDGGMRPIRTSLKGVPDIIGFTDDGRFVGIECKVAPDTLRDEQKVFREALEARQGIYMVVVLVKGSETKATATSAAKSLRRKAEQLMTDIMTLAEWEISYRDIMAEIQFKDSDDVQQAWWRLRHHDKALRQRVRELEEQCKTS